MLFFFQAEDGIRDAQESRGLGDVYKRQDKYYEEKGVKIEWEAITDYESIVQTRMNTQDYGDCLLYTSDAADDLLCVDLGGRRIIKKKQKKQTKWLLSPSYFLYIFTVHFTISLTLWLIHHLLSL